jgi:hypothetical protein
MKLGDDDVVAVSKAFATVGLYTLQKVWMVDGHPVCTALHKPRAARDAEVKHFVPQALSHQTETLLVRYVPLS